ncbi:hypothetical protein JOD43_004389 [Pullulanibacillus pueri]|uniref:Uncharacterized protein n=1 Tax=Pullulanibacillus pueri TaxID=1437324 RepID=A0A8J3EPQ0_9BACL|nr:hypothetical protein [Pullulanibacillus pueri]MBM7684176.1 hypothetical protein [Pullulanibacillus pueri]GGH88814.1 hypothetical protein GCM10007096_42000 [Pullulanibacillus pueri]
MEEKKKQHYYYIITGRIGVLLIFVSGIRYIIISDDVIGRGLMTFGLLFVLSYFKFMDSKLLTYKEKRIVDWIFYILLLVIFIVSLLFVLYKHSSSGFILYNVDLNRE